VNNSRSGVSGPGAAIRRLLVAAAAFSAAGSAGVAAAQESSVSGLEEITVTARRRAEELQDVPITITAFTAVEIERRGIRTIQDVARLTPGLSFDKGFAPQDTRPNIRGLPTTRGRPPIGILLDGIDISSESIATAGGSSFMNLKLVDVERIEVVKGPQSALYGRVAFGGAINYVSKKPSVDETEGSLNLDIASDGLYEGRGAFNTPLIDGRLGLRVNAIFSDFDGFYRNTVSGEKLGGWNTAGVAAALRFVPSDKADFTLRLSYSDDDTEPRPSYYNGGTTSLALPANAVGLRLGVPPGGTPLPASIPYPMLGEVQNGTAVRLSVDPLTGKDYEGGRVKAFIGSLVGEVDLGFATLTTLTGYLDGTALSRADADFNGAVPTAVTLPSAGTAENLPAFQVTDLDTDVRQFSQELRLGRLDKEGFRWAIGALYWREEYDSVNASAFINGFFRNPPFAPAGWSAARELQIRGPLPGQLNSRNTTHYSGYVIGEYDFSPKFNISAEARYSDESFDYLFGRALNLSVTATGTVNPVALAGNVFTPMSSSDFFAPKVTLNYKPTDEALIYLTASKGVKPAGFLNVAVVFDANDAFYKPEELWNYEAGFKTSWLDDRLRLNGAYFHMIYKDRINQLLVPDTRSPQGTSTLVVNQGEAKVDGVELELSAALGQGWNLNLAYTFLDARFTDSAIPSTAALNIAGSGNCQLGNVGPQVVCFTNTDGKSLEQSARNALIASLSYRRVLENGWRLNSEIAAQYRSKRFMTPDNRIWLPAHTNVDAQIGFENDSYSVLLYATNLFDYDKPTSAQTYGDPFIALPVAPPVLAYTTYPADPRQVGLRVGFRF
jgi:outer membrane receptor protein involved in Fe transport